jgi:hypothetical protein
VDPRTWRSVRQRLAELAAELHEAARPPHTPGTTPLGVSMMAFPLQDVTRPQE